MTPPTALSPYSTAPLLPRVISMRSIELRGMVEKSTPAMSMSLSLRPLMSTRVFEVAKAPKPRRSTDVLAPLTPPNRLVSCTPGTCAMISCNGLRGRMRDLFGGNNGRRRADDAVRIAGRRFRPRLARRFAMRRSSRSRLRAACRSTAQPPARRGARSMLHRRSVLRGSGSGRWARLPRSAAIALTASAAPARRKCRAIRWVSGSWWRARSGAAAWRWWKTWLDLGMTSVARHSEPSLTMC